MATSIIEPENQLNEPPDDCLWEFVDGDFVEKQVGSIQNLLANELKGALDEVVKAKGLGRVLVEMVFDFRTQNGRKRRPDVAFVSTESARPASNLDWEVVPELAVEVVSQSKSFAELIDKKNEYFQLGVSQVWIVVPSAREIHVYESSTKQTIFAGDTTLQAESMFPGFQLSLAEFFDSVETSEIDQNQG